MIDAKFAAAMPSVNKGLGISPSRGETCNRNVPFWAWIGTADEKWARIATVDLLAVNEAQELPHLYNEVWKKMQAARILMPFSDEWVGFSRRAGRSPRPPRSHSSTQHTEVKEEQTSCCIPAIEHILTEATELVDLFSLQ